MQALQAQGLGRRSPGTALGGLTFQSPSCPPRAPARAHLEDISCHPPQPATKTLCFLPTVLACPQIRSSDGGGEGGIEGFSKAPGLRKQQDRKPPGDANTLPSRYATQFIKLLLFLTFVLPDPWPPLAFYHLRLSQEIDGPQAEDRCSPCGQILQDETEEKLSPTQIRDHTVLILQVKETFLTTHAQKGSLEA